jgi:hypothetical protein
MGPEPRENDVHDLLKPPDSSAEVTALRAEWSAFVQRIAASARRGLALQREKERENALSPEKRPQSN